MSDSSAMRWSVQAVVQELADAMQRLRQMENVKAESSAHKVTISRLERHATALENQVLKYRKRAQASEQSLATVKQKDAQLLERVQVNNGGVFLLSAQS